MNKKHIFVGIFVLCFVAGAVWAQKTATASSVWTPMMLMIDGQPTEWANDRPTMDEKANAEFSFRNDANYFYAILTIKDVNKMRRNDLAALDLTGITMYYNIDGKKKKNDGLRFFGRVLNGEQMVASLEAQGQKLSEAQKTQILSQNVHVMYMYDLVNEREKKRLANATVTDPPVFKFTQQGTLRYYEFRIPMTKDDAHPIGIGAAPGQDIMVGFEWCSITPNMLNQLAAQMNTQEMKASERSSGFNPGAEGGVSGMRGDGDLSRIRRMMPTKRNVWTAVKLAENE